MLLCQWQLDSSDLRTEMLLLHLDLVFIFFLIDSRFQNNLAVNKRLLQTAEKKNPKHHCGER